LNFRDFGEDRMLVSDELAANYSTKAKEDLSEKLREGAMLFLVAEGRLNEEEEAEEGLKAARDALAAFQEAGDKEGHANARRLVNHFLMYLGQWKDAASGAIKDLADFQKASFESGVAKMMLSLAEANSYAKEEKTIHEAHQSAKGAQRLFGEQGDERMAGMCRLAIVDLGLSGLRLNPNKEKTDEVGKRLMEPAMEAKELFNKLGDRKNEARALHAVASCYALSENFVSLWPCAQDALDIFQELGHRKLEAFELMSHARWLVLQGKVRKATPLAEEASEIYHATGGPLQREVKALQLLCDVHIKVAVQDGGTIDAALNVAKSAAARFEEADEKLGQAAAQEMMSSAYKVAGNLDEAQRCAERALTTLRGVDDKQGEVKVLGILTEIYIQRDLYQKAISTSQTVCGIQREVGTPLQISEALMGIANVYRAKGDDKLAVNKAQEALAILTELGDKKSEAAMLREISAMQVAAGEHRQALRNLAEAREIYEELEDDTGLTLTLVAVAHVHALNIVQGIKQVEPGSREWNEGLEKAMRTGKEAASIAKEIGEEVIRAYALAIVAQVLMLKERHKEAAEMSNEAVFIFRNAGDESNEAFVLMLCADSYFELGQMTDAKAAAEEALDIFKYIEDEEGQREAEERLQQISPPQQMMFTPQHNFAVQSGQPGQPQPVQQGNIPFQPKMAQQQQAAAAQGASMAQRVAGATLDVSQGLSLELVTAKVKEITMSLIGEDADEDVEDDSPLMGAGLTSTTAVLLRDSLNEEIPGIKLPPTLVFDYPSIGAIAQFIVGGDD